MTRSHMISGRRIKILFFLGSLSGGGAERFVSTALQFLDRDRYEPGLALLRDDIAYRLAEGVPVAVVGPSGKSHPWTWPATIVRLARLIDEWKPDVVLSAFAHYNRLACEAIALSNTSPRWIARVAVDPTWDDRGYLKLWSSRAYRRAGQVMANSKGLAEALPRQYPSLAGRVRTLYNPTDFREIDRLSKEKPVLKLPHKPTVISVGRLNKQKRHDLLLRSFAMAAKKVDACLVILGDGKLRSSIEDEIRALSLQESVLLPGFQDNPYAVLARCDLFVLSSDYEGLPNALIEAQGIGLASVSTDCPYGPSEIIDPGKTGLLGPTGDVDKLAAAIVELLEAPDTRRAMGDAARQRARHKFSVHAVLSELQALIESCVEQN